MSTTLRRPFHSSIRAIDSSRGIVQYISSSQAIDSYNEVVSMQGWDGSRLEKNAPVVDSHNYASVECLLGKIVQSAIRKGQLIQDVQFAIDVPSNVLAQKAFAMVEAGYLKGCSIGFIPTETVSRFDNSDQWDEVMDDLGLGDLENSIRCVYTKWQQLELSICCIGANPDAVVIQNAVKAGILDDHDLERWPAARRALESVGGIPRRSYSLPSPEAGRQSRNSPTTHPMSKQTLLDSIQSQISAAIGESGITGKTSDALISAQRGQSESELFRAVGKARFEMARHRRHDANAAILRILADDEKRRYYNTLLRALARVSVTGGSDAFRAEQFLPFKTVAKMAPGDFGGGLLPIDVSRDFLDLALIYGAHKDLGVTPMTSMFTKFPQTKTTPQGYWLMPARMSIDAIPADTTLTGASLTPEANTLAVILTVSVELLMDEKADLSYFLLSKFSQAIAAVIDYAAFSGNGTADTTNGGQTGIFLDNTIAAAQAAQGNPTLASLAHADFINAIGSVSAATLQRPCRWFINPAFIGQLMLLVDSQAKGYLLTPPTSQDDEWRLCGYPVTWAAQAPSASTPGSKIAAFGWGPAYMIALRETMEVMLRDGNTGFSQNTKSFRALGRGFVQTRDASGLATLALAQV